MSNIMCILLFLNWFILSGFLALTLTYKSYRVFFGSFSFLSFSIALSSLSNDYELNATTVALIYCGLMSVTVGAVLTHMVLPKSAVNISGKKAKFQGAIKWYLIVSTFSLVCLAFFFILFKKNGTIPIFSMLIDQVSPKELKEIRAASYKTNSGLITFPMSILRSSVAPIIVVVATHFISHGKYRITSYSAILISLLYSTYSTAIFPTAYLILIIALYFIFQFRLRLYSIITCLSAAFITLNVPVLFDYFGQVGNTDSIPYSVLFIDSISRHVGRFVYDQAKLIESYTVFVESFGFGGGAYHAPTSFFIGKREDVANLVFLFNDPNGYYLGKASVPFMGGAYADGVFLAVIFTGVNIGALLIFGELIIRRYTLSPLRDALTIAYAGQGWLMPSALFGTGIISKGWLPSIIICIFISKILVKESKD